MGGEIVISKEGEKGDKDKGKGNEEVDTGINGLQVIRFFLRHDGDFLISMIVGVTPTI